LDDQSNFRDQDVLLYWRDIQFPNTCKIHVRDHNFLSKRYFLITIFNRFLECSWIRDININPCLIRISELQFLKINAKKVPNYKFWMTDLISKYLSANGIICFSQVFLIEIMQQQKLGENNIIMRKYGILKIGKIFPKSLKLSNSHSRFRKIVHECSETKTPAWALKQTIRGIRCFLSFW